MIKHPGNFRKKFSSTLNIRNRDNFLFEIKNFIIKYKK